MLQWMGAAGSWGGEGAAPTRPPSYSITEAFAVYRITQCAVLGCRLSLEVQGWYRQQLEAEPVAFMETTAVAGTRRRERQGDSL
jgi:hypothetical protein